MKICPDCGVKPKEKHRKNCDVARCSECGFQRLMCGHKKGDGGKWEGEWPGLAECREFGLYSRFGVNGWEVGLEATDEGVSEDLNTLTIMGARGELVWDKKRWARPRLAGSKSPSVKSK